MRIAVVGSREFKNWEQLSRTVRGFIESDEDEIISGGAIGADSMAQRFCKENGFDIFTTVLSISPHKKAEAINNIGKRLAERYGIRFYEADFKKKDGFKRSLELSREYNLFRQDYCGCIYSKR